MVNILTGDRDHLTKYLAEHQVLCVLDYFFSLTPSSIVTIRTFFGVKNKLKKSFFFLVARPGLVATFFSASLGDLEMHF